ncbi:hypothetical protein [Bacillus taeanensis]|nr:hypothetical protein [Bacillus taeanensis]
MTNYLFLRGNRNKHFFIDAAEELIKRGHQCHQIKFELGELLFNSAIKTTFAPFHVSKKQYSITDEDLLDLPIYNITYKKKILKKTVAKKELTMYKRYMYYIDHYIQENKIDVVCLFNGYHWIDQVTKVIADKRGLTTVYFEDGLFRPYTITCDAKGINANASVPQNLEFYDSLSVNKKRLKDYLFKPENKALLKRTKEDLVRIAFVKGLSMFGSFLHIAPKLYVHITFWQAVKYFTFKKTFKYRKSNELNLEEEYIFLPFQVSRDTQIFYNSPHIQTMEQLLETVLAAVKHLNETENRNIRIIVKEHPEDMARNNYKQLKKAYQNSKDVVFIQKYNIHTLIEKALAVITVNSTVGIEALSKHKKVITLGNAFYNINGIVTHCKHPEKLGETLVSALKEKINKKRIDQFLYYLRFEYQIEGTINSPSRVTAKNVADRLETLS